MSDYAMHNLPSEVLSRIFGYLDFSSRREAALVNRAWYEASLHPCLLKNTKFTFDVSILEDEKYFNKGQHLCVGCLCKSPNLQLVGLDENFNAKHFLKLHESGMHVLGPHVEHLSLKNSSILEKTFLDIVEHCENLKSLDLSGCNSLFMSGTAFLSKVADRLVAKAIFGQLTGLELSSSRYINDGIICRFFALCPSLSSLSLASNNLLCNSLGLSKSNSLTFLVVQQMIEMHSHTITCIDLSRTSVMSEALSMLSSTKGLKLKKVVLQNCKELSDTGVVDLIQKQPGLIELDLSGSQELGDPTVCAACSCLKDLRSLKLRKCQKVTDASIRNLYDLEQLYELDISECFRITMSGLSQGISTLQHLKCLEMKCCNMTKFSDAFLSEKIQHNGNHRTPNNTLALVNANNIHQHSVFPAALLHLEISSSQYVDDATLQAINVHMVNLEVLRLGWCSSVTDFGLLGIDGEIGNVIVDETDDPLYQLKIKEFLSTGKYSTNHGYGGLIQRPGDDIAPGDTNIYDSLCEKMVKESLEARGIIRLRHLRELDLSNCRKLTDNCLKLVFRYNNGPFKHLVKLNLSMLFNAVTDAILCDIIQGDQQLTHLNIGFAVITDEGVLELSKRLRRLHSLNLPSCDGITERSLTYLSTHCTWLKTLDLSMCRSLKAGDVARIRDSMPNVSTLHSRYSGGASFVSSNTSAQPFRMKQSTGFGR